MPNYVTVCLNYASRLAEAFDDATAPYGDWRDNVVGIYENNKYWTMSGSCFELRSVVATACRALRGRGCTPGMIVFRNTSAGMPTDFCGCFDPSAPSFEAKVQNIFYKLDVRYYDTESG